MDDILYSIITPVFNRADCIIRCMESVERAINKVGGEIFEHVIVDDGSTDATASMVEEYAKQHPYVKFVKFAHNKGTNAARNTAIREAQGKWCIILDSDDYFVDEALQIICNTMNAHSGYKHYMFAPDDMQGYYATNHIIQGTTQIVLSYSDFLNGNVGGDFIHVCSTEILRMHPFDERLRIYEGVFFLMFFREAQQMLFTNKVVTIRERSRADSVTREVLRTNDKVIERGILSNEIYLDNFEEDMNALGMNDRLREVHMELLDNYVLLGKYREAKELMAKIGSIDGLKGNVLKTIVFLRLGFAYKLMLRLYLVFKYKVMKKKLLFFVV